MLLIANNVTSLLNILVLWWLVHESANDNEPYGKPIAVGYALWALCVMALMLFRNVQITGPLVMVWLPVAAKAIIFCVLALVALRLRRLHRN